MLIYMAIVLKMMQNVLLFQDKEPEPEPVETPGQIELGKLIAAMEKKINAMKGAEGLT